MRFSPIVGHDSRRRRRGVAIGLALAATPLLGTAAGASTTHTATSSAAGSTLTFARIGSSSSGFGPFRQSTGNDHIVNALMFDNLVRIAPNEKTVVPDLASKWTASPDATVFTFFLQKGVKWSDGKPFTAADVVYTATAACQLGVSAYLGYQPTEWRQIAGCSTIVGTTSPLSGVTAVNPYEVRMTLAAPNAIFIRGLTDAVYSIVPQHILQGTTAANTWTIPFTTTSPVGTGPYRLVEDVPNQYYEFKANPHYFLGAPKIKTLIYRVNETDSEALAQIATGQLQLALDFAPTDAATLAGDKGIVHKFEASPAGEFMEFRADNPLVANALVREAVMYAVDRRTMLTQIAAGEGEILTNALPGFNPNLKSLNSYPYDPTKAKALLQQANYNFSAPFIINYAPDADPLWAQMAPAIQAYLQAVGINAVLNPLSSTAWTAALANKTPTYAMMLNSGGSMGLFPDKSSVYFNCQAPANTYYANCALDADYAKARSTTNIKVVNTAYGQVAQLLNQQVPMATLWQTDNLDAWSKKLGGTFAIFSNDRDTTFNVNGWTLK